MQKIHILVAMVHTEYSRLAAYMKLTQANCMMLNTIYGELKKYMTRVDGNRGGLLQTKAINLILLLNKNRAA